MAESSPIRRARLKLNGLCANCGARPPITGRAYCTSCRSSMQSCAAKNNAKYRQVIFKYFGDKCACCGEQEVAFLTVDHINNDGWKARRENSTGGTNFYKLVSNAILAGNPPNDLQLLCRNCNWGKHINGGMCPHIEKYVERQKRQNPWPLVEHRR